MESFQRSLDYDRDLQDGVAAYQNGDFERYLAKVFDDAGRSSQAATKAKAQFLAAYNRLRAPRATPSATTSDHAPHGSSRRRAARPRPRRGLRARGSLADCHAAPAATAATDFEAERNAAAQPRGRRGRREADQNETATTRHREAADGEATGR